MPAMARRILDLFCTTTIFFFITSQLIPAILDSYATGFCLRTLVQSSISHRRGILDDIICRHSTITSLFESSLDRILVLQETARKTYDIAANSADTCTIIQAVQDNGPALSCNVSEYRIEAQDHLQTMVKKAEIKRQSQSAILAHWDQHRNAVLESALQLASSPERQRHMSEGILKLGFLSIFMFIFLWRGIRSAPMNPAQLQPPPQQVSETANSPVRIKIEEDEDDEVKPLLRPPMAQLRGAPAAPPARAQSLPAFRYLAL